MSRPLSPEFGIINGTKKCSRCLVIKSLEEYSPCRRTEARQWCRDCYRIVALARPSTPARLERDRRRGKLYAHRHTVKRHGLTPEQYADLLEQQGGVCAGCGTPPGAKRLAVDHDHKTGEVRGLLCFPCNVILGQVSDDPSRLRRLADYLEAQCRCR